MRDYRGQKEGDELKTGHGVSWLAAAAVLLVAGGLLASHQSEIAAGLWSGLAWLGDPQSLAEHYRELGAWAVVISTGLLVLETVVAPLPGWPVVMANGVVFGLSGGVAISLAGAWLGAMITFAIGRRYGQAWFLARLDADRQLLVQRLSRRDGFALLVLLRLVPVTSLDIIGYMAGLSTVRPRVYAAATALGLLPGVVAYTLVGLALAELGLVTALLTALGLVLAILYLSYRFGPALRARLLSHGGRGGT